MALPARFLDGLSFSLPLFFMTSPFFSQLSHNKYLYLSLLSLCPIRARPPVIPLGSRVMEQKLDNAHIHEHNLDPEPPDYQVSRKHGTQADRRDMERLGKEQQMNVRSFRREHGVDVDSK